MITIALTALAAGLTTAANATVLGIAAEGSKRLLEEF